MNKPRAGEVELIPSRNPRYVCSNGIWYFKKRGGKQAGPFATRDEMQSALNIYIHEQKTAHSTATA